MRITRSLEFLAGSKEEKLPYADPDFPYLASRTELDYFREHSVPWHWHSALELFYMESGALTYHTPRRHRGVPRRFRRHGQRQCAAHDRVPAPAGKERPTAPHL